LYSFFARRTADREDAEDMLVETMVRARADVLRRPTSGAPLLGRLIGLATHALAANLAMDREAESGLKPNWSSGDVRTPRGVYESAARLSRAERLAVGLRFADGLPTSVIAVALGKSEPAVEQLLQRVMDKLVEREGGLANTALHKLDATRRTVELDVRQEARIWSRYDEEEDEFVVGPAPLRTPRIVVALVTVVVLTLGVGMMYRTRPPNENLAANTPTPQAAARTPASADASTSAFGASNSAPGQVATATRALGQAGRSDIRGTYSASLQFQNAAKWHSGQVYFVERVPGGARLVAVDFDRENDTGEPWVHAVVESSESYLPYSLSPFRLETAYGRGPTLLLGRGVPFSVSETVVLTLKDPPAASSGMQGGESLNSPHTWRVGALAWQPTGGKIALVAEPLGAFNPFRPRILLHDLVSRSTEIVTVLAKGEKVFELSWNPGGGYLLANTSKGALILHARSGARKTYLKAPAYRAQWGPIASKPRLLWIAKGPAGANKEIGFAGPGGWTSKSESKALHAGWTPDGEGLIVARHEEDDPESLSIWRWYPRDGEETLVSNAPRLAAHTGRVAYGPDGGHLVYGDDDGVYMAHLARGRVARVLQTEQRPMGVRWLSRR